MNTHKKSILLAILSVFFLFGCGSEAKKDNTAEEAVPIFTPKKTEETDPMKNKGIGPVTEVKLGEINKDMALEGEKLFTELCTACHKPNEKYIGPAPKGVLDRRSPEWVMNMILNPTEMVQKDPVAKKLLMEFNGSPMANQNLKEDQARKILEYFRTL